MIAGQAGVLLKEPVHEEITQLAFGCPLQPGELGTETRCAGADKGFANHFVIYGVRWNDLPPFRLEASEGAKCKKLFILSTPACKTNETIRLSTQPDCWYCIFKQGQELAARAKITGCARGTEYVRGNLLTRSHFGDLQFLHSMANEDGVTAEATRQKVVEWLEFAWRVSIRELRADVRLRDVKISVIQEHFSCSEWTVADLYVLGRQNAMLPHLHQVAFGSILHSVQDSFAAGHTERETMARSEACPGADYPAPGRVVEFHSYARQDGHAHDGQDKREAMVVAGGSDWPHAIAASRHLMRLHDSRTAWSEAKPFIDCLFELAPEARPSSPGERFIKSASH
ncbi:MAG: hypothetical protein AB7E83_08910 [Ramlibacter sp.]